MSGLDGSFGMEYDVSENNYGGENAMGGGYIEGSGGGDLKEIKQQEKITNWSYSDKEEDKVEDKGSKPEKKSKKTKKNTSKKKKVKEEDKEPEPKVVKKKKVSDEFDLEAQFEKLVYEDIVYIHNLDNNKVYNLNDEEIGVYKNKRIKWSDDEYKKQHLVAKDKYNEEYNKELVLSSSEDEETKRKKQRVGGKINVDDSDDS